MENIEQRVKKIVAEQLGVNEGDVKNASSFVNDLGATQHLPPEVGYKRWKS